MNRVRTLHILTAACASGGVGCFVLAASDGGGDTPASLFALWVGPILFAFAAAAACGASHRLIVACGQLAAQVRAAAPATPLKVDADCASILPTEATVAPLCSELNQLIGTSHRAVIDSTIAVKELEIRLRLANAERQHAETILHSIADGVLVTDPFDELVLANEAAARTFDFELGGGSQRPIETLLRDRKIVQYIQEVRAAGEGQGQRTVEHEVVTPSGARTFKLTLSHVADVSQATGESPDEARGGVVAVLHDVTREREVAAIKNDFVSMVSHELRTPLASIKAYIEMLIDGEAVEEKTTHEFYDVIQSEANRLDRLIDNILNISRIESGLVRPDKHPQSLAVVIKEALEVIAPQAGQKKVHFCDDITPVYYQTLADHDMLYQAVLNLLGNAVKYTPTGGTVTVRTTVDEESRKVLTRITDTGVGIPAADLPFVFEKFFRSEANNSVAQGTGLGLALVKQIIENVHGGRVFVESQTGKGSTFGFELPLCE